VDIDGHTPIPTGSSWQGFQVDFGGLQPNPTELFWKFSCQYIFMYFEGHFGALNNVFLAFHSQTVDGVRFCRNNLYF
jgi:hypothetical protein